MSNSIRREIQIPQPREMVWHAITDSATLAEWMYPNNFEPRVGHRFTFHVPPKPKANFDGIVVQCEVLECEPPSRLVFSWSAGGPVDDTRVTFRLEAEGDGTRLFLEHSGFDLTHPWGKQALRGGEYGWAMMLKQLASVANGLATIAPDNTAVRTALWRALHLEVDSPPHVIEDDIGLKLAAPDDGWQSRPDMSPFTRPFRASIVARARFIEDLVVEQAAAGVDQYVILGAGLDTFAQRRPEVAARLVVFEIDQPGPLAWKRKRLIELGLGIPFYLRLVPVDFEAGDTWMERLTATGFDTRKPAVVASTGVSMYLTQDAVAATLRQIAELAPGTTLAMSFLLPIELVDPELRPGMERAVEGARASGTPFLSFFTPEEIQALAREAGFRDVQHVSADSLTQRYFANRPDGLRPPRNAEELLVATT